MSFISSFLLFLFLQNNDAQAEVENPILRGLAVGGLTTLSTAGGVWAGYAGSKAIYGEDAHYGTVWLGMLLGASISAPVGAKLSADVTGADSFVVTRNTGIASLVGLTCLVAGVVADSDTTVINGGGLMLFAPMLTAGVSAGLFPNSGSAAVTPIITPEYTGLAFQTRF